MGVAKSDMEAEMEATLSGLVNGTGCQMSTAWYRQLNDFWGKDLFSPISWLNGSEMRQLCCTSAQSPTRQEK